MIQRSIQPPPPPPPCCECQLVYVQKGKLGKHRPDSKWEGPLTSRTVTLQTAQGSANKVCIMGIIKLPAEAHQYRHTGSHLSTRQMMNSSSLQSQKQLPE